MTIKATLVVRLTKREGPSVSRAEVIDQLVQDVEGLGTVWVDDTGWDISEVGLGPE